MRWKDIPGYEGQYRVSEYGDIVGPRGKLLRPYRSNSAGREIVSLYKNGQRERWLIYRVVLTAFVGPCPDGMEGCHNDGNVRNNHVSNLRWDTHKNNHADKYRHGTEQVGENHPRNRFTEQDVLRMRDMRRCGAKLAEIGRVFGTSEGPVSAICRRQAWTHI